MFITRGVLKGDSDVSVYEGYRLVRLLHGLGYRDSRAKQASFPGGQEGLEIMELHGRTTALFIGLGPQSPTLGNAPGKCGAP